MNWFTGAVLYVLICWTALFAVLPVGTSVVADADDASGWRGAAVRPMLLRKVVATTVVAVRLWGLCYLVIRSGWISFRNGPVGVACGLIRPHE